MKLTGKCKTDFEKWLYQNYDNELYYSEVGCSEEGINLFNTHKSMQFGVYVDFFDSVDIPINILGNKVHSFEVFINLKRITYAHTRQEVRVLAIEKANEIYNELE